MSLAPLYHGCHHVSAVHLAFSGSDFSIDRSGQSSSVRRYQTLGEFLQLILDLPFAPFMLALLFVPWRWSQARFVVQNQQLSTWMRRFAPVPILLGSLCDMCAIVACSFVWITRYRWKFVLFQEEVESASPNQQQPRALAQSLLALIRVTIFHKTAVQQFAALLVDIPFVILGLVVLLSGIHTFSFLEDLKAILGDPDALRTVCWQHAKSLLLDIPGR